MSSMFEPHCPECGEEKMRPGHVCRTEGSVEMHADGSATIHLPSGDHLSRISYCMRCDSTIGDEAFCEVQDPIARVVYHTRCLVEDDEVIRHVKAI